MADYAIHDTTLTDIANKIRKKDGTSALIDPADYADRINLMGMLEEKTIVSSPIADFSDGSDDVPTRSLVVTIPASLSGVSSITEKQTGLQIADFENNLNNSSYGCTIEKLSGGGIRFYGETTQTYLNLTSLFDCEIKSGATITLSRATARPYRVYVYLKFDDGTTANVIINQNTSSVTYTTSKKVVQIRLDASGLTASTEYDETIYVVLQYGSPAHAFEPYTAPTQYTASLGRTIYGGTADIVNGTGTETYTRIDLGSLEWTYNATRTRFETSSLTAVIKPTANNSTPFNGVCADYSIVAASSVQGTNNSIGVTNIATMLVHNDNYTDPAIFTNAMSGVYVTVELATETAFTFTGQEIPTRLGYNAFWSDEGDTEVTYRSSGTVYNYPAGEGVSF